jgi:hypothetical protein
MARPASLSQVTQIVWELFLSATLVLLESLGIKPMR